MRFVNTQNGVAYRFWWKCDIKWESGTDERMSTLSEGEDLPLVHGEGEREGMGKFSTNKTRLTAPGIQRLAEANRLEWEVQERR